MLHRYIKVTDDKGKNGDSDGDDNVGNEDDDNDDARKIVTISSC